MKTFFATAFVVVAALARAHAGEAAAPVYPWCSHYGGADYGGAIACGFNTFEQCMATVRGTGGSCQYNVNLPQPAPQPATAPRPRQKKTN